MRITIEIDEKQLKAIQLATGLPKKSPAVRKAIEDYLAGQEKKRFLQHVLDGKSDYRLTNDQVEALGMYEEL